MRKYITIFSILIFITFSVGCIFSADDQNPHQLLPTSTTPNNQHLGLLTVHFIDVGLGDSELIQTSTGRTMLIDAGGNFYYEISAENIKTYYKTSAEYLNSIGIKKLDVVVVSNPGNTNIGGMSEILNNFTVREFIHGGDPLNSTAYYYSPLLPLIRQKNIPSRTVKAGDTIFLDPSLTINVLNPQETMSNDLNKNSVVLKMTYGNNSFLFMGGIWGDTENSIAESAGHVDILKVGYNGRNMSTSSAFLSKVKPAVSIIETDSTTTFGYGTTATVQRLKQSGSKVYITGINGTVKVISDGNNYSVISER